MTMTKQGVRDLNLLAPKSTRNKRKRNERQSCFHDWDWVGDVDGLFAPTRMYERCTKCGTER